MVKNSLCVLKNVQNEKTVNFKTDLIKIKKKVIKITGPSNVGKTTVLHDFFNENLKDQTVWLDCALINRKQDIFFSIYGKLFFDDCNSKELLNLDPKIMKQLSSESILEFVELINSKAKKLKQKNYYIVFDHVYFLNNLDKDLIFNISIINDILKNLVFVIVLIDCDTSSSIEFKKDLVHKIKFSSLSSKDIKEVILSLPVFEDTNKQFENFLNSFLLTYSSNDIDVAKLRYPSIQYYSKYLNEKIAEKNFFDQYHKDITNNLVIQTNFKLFNTQSLPCCAKLILISAFLASYNSQSSDQKFFSKYQERNSKKKNLTSVDEKKLINEPKKFTFERFFQIYVALQELNFYQETAINEIKAKYLTNHFLEQFSKLIKWKYILRKSSIKSKSPYSVSFHYIISKVITYQAIHKLSDSLEIELDKFLEKKFE